MNLLYLFIGLLVGIDLMGDNKKIETEVIKRIPTDTDYGIQFILTVITVVSIGILIKIIQHMILRK